MMKDKMDAMDDKIDRLLAGKSSESGQDISMNKAVKKSEHL